MTFFIALRRLAQRVDGRIVVVPAAALTMLGASPFAVAGLNHQQAPHGGAAFSVVQRVGAPFGVAVVPQNLLIHVRTPQDALHAFNQTFRWAPASVPSPSRSSCRRRSRPIVGEATPDSSGA